MKQGIATMLVGHRAFDFTKRIVRRDGEIRSVRCVGVPVTQGETFQGFFGTGMDVTEQERLTRELQRREAYLAEAQRLSHTGSFGWKPGSDEIVWSDETYRIFEYDPTVRITIDSIVQRVHPEDRAEFQEVINHASAGATHFEQAYRLLLPDGRIKHIHALAHVSTDACGNREFVGAGIDVTSIKRAEEELRRSEAYLAEAQRLSKTGSWAWSPDQDIRYWSEECYRVLSFDPRHGLPRFEDFFQRIHPDDQPGLRELIQTAIREKAEWEADYRIVHPDGPLRDIHVVGHPVLSTSGDLVEFVGTVIDVTERKRAEEELRRSEMEIRQMLDFAPQNIAVFGPGGERLYANRNALDHVGLSLEEWRQTPGGFFTPSWFIHPDDRERATRAYSDSTRSGGSAYELEMRVKRPDGSYRWTLVRYNPVRDEQGQITRWYVAGTDIEERKQAEERLRNENIALREEISKASMFEEIVGSSPALRTVTSRIAKVAPTTSTVLITGETGTGKELVARAIHRRSQRCSRPFVSVNCAAIPRDLIASELFGHEKGAFTGALQRRVGKFELAEGGTLFLDEIGELPAETQIALLRVLQEREFERVGGNQAIRTDVRVIAATNRDLQAAISAGTFRSDLFYRLNVFPIEVPPLRARKDDIALLLEYFIDRFARQAGKKIKSIDKKTLELVLTYPWPGNIRELQNVIERSVVLCDTEIFSVDESWLSRTLHPASPTLSRKPALQEKEVIEAALAETRGRVSGPAGAAAKLGIPSTTLESKIKSLKINKHRFKAS
jgi:formate hydrogenlyase transcriptional activator